MKKTRLISLGVVCLLMLTSCAQTYVPKSEWRGLETRAYGNSDYYAYVSAHPDGTPDPFAVQTDEVDSTRVHCEMEKARYSLSADRTLCVRVTYDALTSDEEDSPLQFWSEVNLERRGGTGWERMLHVANLPREDEDAAMVAHLGENILVPGETDVRELPLEDIITKLTRGTYRMIVYLNYQAFYAEFELTE